MTGSWTGDDRAGILAVKRVKSSLSLEDHGLHLYSGCILLSLLLFPFTRPSSLVPHMIPEPKCEGSRRLPSPDPSRDPEMSVKWYLRKPSAYHPGPHFQCDFWCISFIPSCASYLGALPRGGILCSRPQATRSNPGAKTVDMSCAGLAL